MSIIPYKVLFGGFEYRGNKMQIHCEAIQRLGDGIVYYLSMHKKRHLKVQVLKTVCCLLCFCGWQNITVGAGASLLPGIAVLQGYPGPGQPNVAHLMAVTLWEEG